MKRYLLAACAGLLMAAMATPSVAADLPRPAYKAPIKGTKNPVYVAPFSWTGFYVGAYGGYGWARSIWTNAIGSTGDFDLKGALVGGTVGYNLQTGSWVWGLEADGAASWIQGTNVPCGNCETRNNWLTTGRGRLGFAWDNWLPYITGGAAYGNIRSNFAGGSDTTNKLGWTAGAGFEYSFMGEWSAKIEYLYVDLGKATCGVATCGIDTDVTFKSHIGKIGVNYRF